MILRIERSEEDGGTRVRLSGELRSETVENVRREIAKISQPIILDLAELCDVDADGIRWLNTCKARDIRIDNCAPYISEWMRQEKL